MKTTMVDRTDNITFVICPYCKEKVTWSKAIPENIHNKMYECDTFSHRYVTEEEAKTFIAVPLPPLELVAKRYK